VGNGGRPSAEDETREKSKKGVTGWAYVVRNHTSKRRKLQRCKQDPLALSQGVVKGEKLKMSYLEGAARRNGLKKGKRRGRESEFVVGGREEARKKATRR